MSVFRMSITCSLVWGLAGAAAAQGIVVDHSHLALFERIPEQYLEKARNLRILFMDRSVGVNTHDALNCLASADYRSSPVVCRRDYRLVGGTWKMTVRDQRDLASGLVDPYIRFEPSPGRYNRHNWRFFLFFDTWDKMVGDFISGLDHGKIPVRIHPGNQRTSIDPMDFDVLSFQFGYLNVMEGSRISEFFTRLPGDYDDVYDLERVVEARLSGAESPRYFVYWTTNLARAIGSAESARFNQQMRDWCVQQGRILFDFADIQAHDMNGDPCYDNRDGVAYTTPSGNKSENHPDDGKQFQAICQEKTVETDGGHLSTAQGVVSVAKGFWILAARIAGWDPEAAVNP